MGLKVKKIWNLFVIWNLLFGFYHLLFVPPSGLPAGGMGLGGL